MKHVIVIATADDKFIPDNMLARFRDECVVAVEKITDKYVGENYVQTAFYVPSAIVAVHKMYNAPEYDPEKPC